MSSIVNGYTIEPGANLTNADLTFADLYNADLYNANLTNADLFYADLGGADLGGADLSGANLSGAILEHTDLTGANLTDAVLSNAWMENADLTNANLTGANLTGANLTGANLYKTTGVDNLSQEQLASTISKMPTPTINLNDADGVITADEAGDWAGLSGTAYPGTTVTLVSTFETTAVSEPLIAVANNAGVWAITKDDVEQPANGVYNLTATATDGDGNVSDLYKFRPNETHAASA